MAGMTDTRATAVTFNAPVYDGACHPQLLAFGDDCLVQRFVVPLVAFTKMDA